MSERRLPEIPKSIHLAAGRFPVKRVRGMFEKDGTYGLVNWATRRIEIDADLGPNAAWLTLEHERVHAILMDAGIEIVDETLEERICDAIAAARVADMVRPVRVPRAK